MMCLVRVEKVYFNIIITESNNINWVDKSIIDITKLRDIKVKREQQVMIVDRDCNEVRNILIKDINMKSHQIVLGEKRWTPLHIVD